MPPLKLSYALPASLALITTLVIACGPDFPGLLLADRHATLHSRIETTFVFDAAHLVPPPPYRFPNGYDDPARYFRGDEYREEPPPVPPAESIGLSASQYALVLSMRKAATGDAAYALGKELPEEVRLYTAAAVDYAHQLPICTESADACRQRTADRTEKARAQAIRRFKAIVAMPTEQRQLRGVWAAYSLAKLYALNGPATQVDAQYAQARQFARDGNADPLFLAVDSLGEQAREHLYRDDYPGAITLYAEQASHGSMSATSSLKIVAQDLLKHPKLLDKHIHAPIVQRLLIAYVFAFGNNDEAANTALYNAGAIWSDDPKADLYQPKGKPSHLKRLLDAFDHAGIHAPADADKLAAIAYSYGRFDLAARFVQGSESPIAKWVRAKLALRAGKPTEARKLFADALTDARAKGEQFRQRSLLRLQGENATFILAQGDLLQAFDQFYAAAGMYWSDVAYLADRVLTTDELKTFVDAKVPRPPLPTVKHFGKGEDYAFPDKGAVWPAISPAAQLRELLARRLMREGRYDEALRYFHVPADKRFQDPKAREHARAYMIALREARHAWTDVGRAEALYTAASIARWHGMEIMGTELAPDWAETGGNWPHDIQEPKAKDAASPAELARFAATTPVPNERFHYRYTAVSLALQAADNLPPRSGTYGEVLANAHKWIVNIDPEAAAKIYQQYLKHGAAGAYGPAKPDFMNARLYPVRILFSAINLHALHVWARHHKPLVYTCAGVIAIMSTALLGFFLRRRRST